MKTYAMINLVLGNLLCSQGRYIERNPVFVTRYVTYLPECFSDILLIPVDTVTQEINVQCRTGTKLLVGIEQRSSFE